MNRLLITVFVAGSVLAATISQAAISLQFSGVPGSSMAFFGVASQFNILTPLPTPLNPGGHQWWVTGGGSGAAWGLYGDFAGGPWSYGPITVNGSDESALVTTLGGTMTILDALNVPLSGTVNWVEVSTSQFIGGVDAAAIVNLSGLNYGGLNPDLLAFAANGFGSVNLSFQFNGPGMTLTDLTTGQGRYTTSYSGSVAAVPEASTLLAGILLLLPFGASTLRMVRKNRAA